MESFTFSANAVKHMMMLNAQKSRNYQTFNELVTAGLLTKCMGEKMAGSGLQLSHLKTVFSRDGRVGIETLFGEKVDGKIRVTRTKGIIDNVFIFREVNIREDMLFVTVPCMLFILWYKWFFSFQDVNLCYFGARPSVHYEWDCIWVNLTGPKYVEVLFTIIFLCICCMIAWPGLSCVNEIQCGAVMRWSIFTKSSQKTPHSSPMRVCYGVSVVVLKSFWVSATVITVSLVISW